jgi:cytoskeletal protein CcmA (bactofilin family)
MARARREEGTCDLRIDALSINGTPEKLGTLLLTPGSEPTSTSVPTADDPATIGKSLKIKGEVIGSESLYIDGNVEGHINLPGCRVTVGRDAQVSANISARDVVILGRIRGNINASDRVDIRSGASLTGDVTAYRINIGDGASFKGGLDKRSGQ